MFEKIKTNKIETSIKKIEDKQKKIDTQLEYVMAKNKYLTENMKKIFTVWDNFFRGIAVIFSLAFATMITAITRVLYIDDGYKWSFSTVFIGGIIYIAITGLSIWVTWSLINMLLTKKINKIIIGGEKDE